MKLSQLNEIRPGEPDWKLPLTSDHSHEKLYDLSNLDWPSEDEITDIRIDHNYLKDMHGVPKSIPGKFWCNNNQLTSLEGGPERVAGAYHAYENKLTSLKGAPLYAGSLHVDANELTEIDAVIQHVEGVLDLSDNKITSISNLHKKVKHCGELRVAGNPLKGGILGVLLIPGLQRVNMSSATLEDEINRLLPNTRGMEAVLELQDILMDKYK